MMTKNQSTAPLISPRVTLLVVAVVQFMVPFLLSSMNVALPSIGKDLHASAVQLNLIQAAFMLSVATFLLPIGRFADIHGRKKVFISGIAILTLCTFGLSLVPSIELLIVLRFLQGIGSSMIFSTSIAILTSVTPPDKRGRANGVIVAMVYLGMAAGPSASGFIIEYLGWRWVFGLVCIPQLVILTLTLIKLKGEWTSAKGEPFDWLGSLSFILTFSMIIIGAIELTEAGWAKWLALVGLGLMAFVFRSQWRSSYPILDLHLMVENPLFTFSNLATLINYASTFCFIFFFSLYLQLAKGLSPEQAGLLLVIQPLVQSSMALISGRLSDSYSPSKIATLGMGFCAIGLFAGSFFKLTTALPQIIITAMIVGIGLGLFSTPNMTAIMASVAEKHVGRATALISAMRNMGSVVSTTVIAILFSIYLGNQPIARETISQFMDSQRTAFYIFTVLSIVGIMFSSVKGRIANSIVSKR